MRLARLCTAWLVGIALADVLWPPTAPPPDVGRAIAALVGAAGVAWAAAAGGWRGRSGRAMRRAVRSDPRLVEAASLTMVALLAGGRVWLARPRFDATHVAAQRDRGTVMIEGVVVAEPERRDGGVHYVLAIDRVTRASRLLPAHGLVLAQAARFPVFAYGDRLRASGDLITPPTLTDFDYRTYLARKGVHALIQRAHVERVEGGRGGHAVRRGLIALKSGARQALDRALPEPEAALATGILLGDDNGLPARVSDAFRRTNTTHIIAISGANIALLAAALHLVTRRWKRRTLATGTTLGVIAAYTLLVGADPAVVRAAIMGALAVLAVTAGRRAEAVTGLTLAGAAMTAWRPAVIGDLGFQLSVAATLGLIAFAGPLATWVTARAARLGPPRAPGRIRAWLDEAVLVTLAAQATTWPLVAWHTGQLGAAGLIANVLVVPAQPAVMATGALTIAAGWLAAPLGRLAGAVAWLPLAWTIRVVEAGARLPGATVAWRPPLTCVALYYLGLAAVAMPSARRRAMARLRTLLSVCLRRPGGGPACVAFGATAALAWVAALTQPDGLLHTIALDVGQGDAILVVTPNGRRMLVDGGPSPSAVLDGLGRRFAPWDRRLDVVVLTHPDADHIGGLPAVLRRYRVSHIVDPHAPHDTPDARAWTAAVAAEGAAVHTAARGLRITLDGTAGVAADVLWPPGGDVGRALGGAAVTVNDHSVVLAVTHGGRRVLLTGDIEAGVESALLRAGVDVRADALKVAHHGSATSSTPAFLDAVAPRLALISVGAGNRFGHPDAGVLDRLGAAAVRRTDRDGAVDVMTDGDRLWVVR